MVYISMSWDHRVIDGEVATRFLARVKQNLEAWDFAEDLGVQCPPLDAPTGLAARADHPFPYRRRQRLDAPARGTTVRR